MESANSPLTDSASAASDDTAPSPSAVAPSTQKIECNDEAKNTPSSSQCAERPGDGKPKRNMTLDLERCERRRHFLDEDYRPPPADACRIPQPHFLDHTPSPDELDDRSDITNPNFLDDELAEEKPDPARRGALPKRPNLDPPAPAVHLRTQLHYLGATHSSERDKRASQLYRGTWPSGGWHQDTASVRSFSSAGSSCAGDKRRSAEVEKKIDCVYSLLSLLSLNPENNTDLSVPLLEMSRSHDNCTAMRQSGCIPLLVQLIHSAQHRDVRNRAAQALRNIIHAQTDDKAGRREARVWRLLEQVREYCYFLEDSSTEELQEEDMNRHPSQCVAALMKLSFDEEHRHVVCQLGGLQALARLVSADQAAHGSRQEEGACVTMRKYAGMTLTNLTFGDGNNKSLLCSFKDFMLALVDQLQSPNDDMRQVTSAVLRNLSWRADTNSKQVLREVGAVKGLTEAAMNCQKEATLKSVLSALWNLTAHCSMNKVALCSVEGALGFLVNMLSYNSPTKTLAIVENAGGIMRNVSSHIAVREDYRQILRERNCLSVLLQHLKSPSLTVVSNSCGTLWNLSARCPQDQQFLWDQGAVPMLRSLIHSKHKMIAMGSSAALKNLLNSKPGKNHIVSLDSTARSMNLPVLPTLGVRKQKALEQEIDQNLAETCDNIEPATSPSTTNRDEKNLFSATERQLAMNLERHRMTSSSPVVGHLASQNSLSHSAHLAGFLSCSNTLLKGALVSRSVTSGSPVNKTDSKESFNSIHSDTAFDRTTRKVPIPTPRTRDVNKNEDEQVRNNSKAFKQNLKSSDQTPVPPPRNTTELSRTNFATPNFDADIECDQPIDYSRKYSEAKSHDPSSPLLAGKSEKSVKDKPNKKYLNKDTETFGDYQETDLDQPTDYSLRYAENHSETNSDISEPNGPSSHEDTIQHFCTEGTPYETPITFSTATSISDLRIIGNHKSNVKSSVIMKSNPEVMTQSDEKDTCSIEEPPRHDNDVVTSSKPIMPEPEKSQRFDTKFSSGMVSPEKPVNYCEEGTPGCFSRVSSLSSIDGEFAEETSLAKKNAMATIHAATHVVDKDCIGSKDKDGSKAVTFACTPEPASAPCDAGTALDASPPAALIEDTPLVFSRCSSPSSLSGCSIADPTDDHASVVSEISRLTSGWVSPSEIPDSPTQSAMPDSPPHSTPQSPRATRPDALVVGQLNEGPVSVFEELPRTFLVENTPAHFSAGTSLSSLTIDDSAHNHQERNIDKSKTSHGEGEPDIASLAEPAVTRGANASAAVQAYGGAAEDWCRVYCTQDTPAPLSRAGSAAALSALSLDTSGERERARRGSDSSSLSDNGQTLLNECILKGMTQTVRKSSHFAELAPAADAHRDLLFRSLPPCLRASPECVSPPRCSTAILRTDRPHSPERPAVALSSEESPPPPLPPRLALPPPPPPPPRPPAPPAHPAPVSPPTSSDDDRVFWQAVQSGMQVAERRQDNGITEKPRDTVIRADSLSSLSLDSYGSTDREIFEECVRKGLSGSGVKAHSAERVLDVPVDRARRTHKSLDRDKVSRRARVRDPQLDRICKSSKRREGRGVRDASPRRDTSNSLSSLSGDSFGSTDRELFEKCVQLGMTKSHERETRSRHRRSDLQRMPGALDRMTGKEDSRDKALLEEMISRGAGEHHQSKNVPAPSVERAPADGNDALARITSTPKSGSDPNTTFDSKHSPDTTLSESAVSLDRSNEFPAIPSADITVESEVKDLLEQSNESYAHVLDGSTWSEITSTPKDKELKTTGEPHQGGHTVEQLCAENAPKDSEISALPDLLENSSLSTRSFSGPDLTDRLQQGHLVLEKEISFLSLGDGPQSLHSSTLIEEEAARLAEKLRKRLEFPSLECSINFDLENERPPSNMGSLVSLTQSLSKEEFSRHKLRKKSLPVALMVKRALSSSYTCHSSTEHIDSGPVSLLENVKPPSEFEHIDMESSIVSVASIVSEVADKDPSVHFDLRQPVFQFAMPLSHVEDLENVDPPSLLQNMTESTIEPAERVESKIYDFSTTLQLTDYASASEDCSPLPSDLSSLETTPKRSRNPKYLTAKEKRQVSKERYFTYTIADESNATGAVLTVRDNVESDLMLESDSRSEEYLATRSENKIKRKLSTKQRRQEDRARYQTQTVDVSDILAGQSQLKKSPDPQIEDLKRRLAAKKSLRERRTEDAERYRTRTIEDVSPSPTYVSDVNLENVETTTGYDSLSSNEPNHQQLCDDRIRDADLQLDSGTNDDDVEINSVQFQTYTASSPNYSPVIENPIPDDICVANNLKNTEMNARYRRDAELRHGSDSESETLPIKSKPKIIKPTDFSRDNSLDSTGSFEDNCNTPKAIRGKKKPAYISPYRRNIPAKKSPVRPIPDSSGAAARISVTKPSTKLKTASSAKTQAKRAAPARIAHNSAPVRTQVTVPSRVPPNLAAAQTVSKPLPLERQGTFTKEESTLLPNNSEKKPTVISKIARPSSSKPSANTSPSRLPQLRAKTTKPLTRRTLGAEQKQTVKQTFCASMKNSPSTQSLQSNESVKTVTLASGSGTSKAEPLARGHREAESKIAGLWRKVEQSKKHQQNIPDRRVWIASEECRATNTPKLIRSSTFEGQPKPDISAVAAPKTKSSIAIRVSQVPLPRYGTTSRATRPAEGQRKPFLRKAIVKHEIAT